MQIIVFNLGNEKFALETKYIHGIEKMMAYTNVPLSPNYIKGLINLRGNIITIIDLRAYLNMEYMQKEENIIVVQIDEEKIGFIVDSVHEVIEVSENIIEKLDNNSDQILGIIKCQDYLATLLDGGKLLNNTRL